MPPDRIGRYRVEKTLGIGGMGEVYKAFDEQLQRPVAIKGLLSERASPERKERLRREALSAAALSHPAIAHVYEIVPEGERDWLVMEFVEGKSLAEILLEGPIPAAEVVRIGEQIARALAEAHAHGIVHRDIKTDNVMLTSGGHVKVLDFGLAKWTGERKPTSDKLTSDGIVVGTSKAMSPEQALGKEVDARSDIFSLGSLLYELAAGKPAFAGGTPMETMYKVARGKFEPLREAAPSLSPHIAAIIERCLAFSPGDRYQSAGAVAESLHPLLVTSFKTMAAAHPVTLTALYAQVRQHTWVGITIMVVATAAIVLTVRAGWVAMHRPLTVAVLPVEAQAPGDAARLASAAVADAIATHLARLENVIVVTGREVRGAVTPGKKATDIARELGVGELIETSLTQAKTDEPARISLRRIDGETGRMKWSDQLEVGTDDLLLLEDRITTALEDGYRGFSTARGMISRETNVEALAAYLEVQARIDSRIPSRDYKEEIALLERAMAVAPRYLEPVTRLASIHRYLFDVSQDPAEKSVCETLLRRAASLAPSDPRVAILRIDLSLSWGDYREAETAARNLTVERPGHADAWQQLGRVLQRLNRYDEAEAALRRAMSLRPYWDYAFDLADVVGARGNTALAQKMLRELVASFPNNVRILARLGYYDSLAGDFTSAERLFRKTVELRGSANDLNNLGSMLFYQRRFKEAAEWLQKAAAMAPNQPFLLVNLADAQRRAGDGDAARRLYAKALSIADDQQRAGRRSASLHRSRAICLAHLGRGTEGVLESQAALEQMPNDAYTAFVAASVAALNGDRHACLAWSQRAMQLGAQREWFSGPEFAAMRTDATFSDLVSTSR